MNAESNGEEHQKKIYFVNKQLKELHLKLPPEIQSKIPLEHLNILSELSNLLVEDANIFEILKGLKECQNTTETILKSQRDEQVLANQREIENYTRNLSENELAHTVTLARIQHAKKIREIDLNIIQQLDNSVKEQQQTLHALNIPGFYETNDSQAICLQMHLIAMCMKIQKSVESLARM